MNRRYDLGIITAIRYTPKDYFIECINSVKALALHTSFSFEWIIVVDGDNRAIDSWIKSNLDPKSVPYQLLAFDNHIGLNIARNYAVDCTSSRYITWLDADDLLNVREAVLFFRRAIEILTKQDEVVIVYSDNIETDQKLRPKYIRKKSFFYALQSKYRNTKYDPIFYVDFIYQAQVLRKSDFLTVGGFGNNVIGEDVDLILKIATYFPNKQFLNLPYNAYIYRKNPNGIVSTRYNELRAINCKSYQYYSKLADVYNSYHVIFQVMFLDEKEEILSFDINSGTFFNVFLPIDNEVPFYINVSGKKGKEVCYV